MAAWVRWEHWRQRNGSIQEVFKIKYKRFSDRLNTGEVTIKEGSVRNDSSVCASR